MNTHTLHLVRRGRHGHLTGCCEGPLGWEGSLSPWAGRLGCCYSCQGWARHTKPQGHQLPPHHIPTRRLEIMEETMSLPSLCSWALLNEGRNERLSLQERALPLGLAVIERAALFPGCGLGQYRRTIGELLRGSERQFFPSKNFKLVHLKNHQGFHSSNKAVSLEQSHIQFCLLKKKKNQDLPGGPMVKTSPSSPWGMSSIPGWGVRIPKQKKKKKKKTENRKTSKGKN